MSAKLQISDCRFQIAVILALNLKADSISQLKSNLKSEF